MFKYSKVVCYTPLYALMHYYVSWVLLLMKSDHITTDVRKTHDSLKYLLFPIISIEKYSYDRIKVKVKRWIF